MGRVLENTVPSEEFTGTHTLPSEEFTGTHRPLVCSARGCSTKNSAERCPLLWNGSSPAWGPPPDRALQTASGLEAAAGTDELWLQRVPWLPASRRLGAPTLNHILKGCHWLTHTLLFQTPGCSCPHCLSTTPLPCPPDSRLRSCLIWETSPHLHLPSAFPTLQSIPFFQLLSLPSLIPRLWPSTMDVPDCFSES